VDLTNPQTWNRYAYVANNPLSNVDPLGLYLDDCTDYWDPWSCGDFPIAIPICLDLCFGHGGGGGGGGGGRGGGGTRPPSAPPPPPSSVNFGDETLGIPSNLQHPWGIWSAIIPGAQCGDITCPMIGSGLVGNVLSSFGSLDPGLLTSINFLAQGIKSFLFQKALPGTCQESTGTKPFFYAVCPNWDPPMVFVGPSWTCIGDRSCCLDAERKFTDSCSQRGLRGAFFNAVQGHMEAACCKLP